MYIQKLNIHRFLNCKLNINRFITTWHWVISEILTFRFRRRKIFLNDAMSYSGTVWYYLLLGTGKTQILPLLKHAFSTNPSVKQKRCRKHKGSQHYQKSFQRKDNSYNKAKPNSLQYVRHLFVLYWVLSCYRFMITINISIIRKLKL